MSGSLAAPDRLEEAAENIFWNPEGVVKAMLADRDRLLDEIAARDRKIAELETALQMARQIGLEATHASR